MADINDMQSWELSELIERFEKDIVSEAGRFDIGFFGSRARIELERRGKEALKAIVEYLRKTELRERYYLGKAWCWLLHNFEIVIDPEKSGPPCLSDLQGWYRWAEKMVQPEKDDAS